MDHRLNKDSEYSTYAEILDFLGCTSSSGINRGVKRKRLVDTKSVMEAHQIALTNAISSDDVTSVDRVLGELRGVPLEGVTVGPYDFRSETRRFPLVHFAAREGSINVLRYLVENQSLNINSFTKPSGTPLSRAVHSSHDACVEYLLNAGCDVNRKVPVCQIRECRVNLVTPLMIALSRDNPGIVRRLLTSGRCDVNVTAGFRETALYFAIKHPAFSLQYVQLLLQAGVNPNIKSTTEEPPLLLALKLGRTEVAKRLIAHGCDVNDRKDSPASFGITALHLAAEMDDAPLVRGLVEAGAALEVRMDPHATLGATPLLHCVAGNRSYNAMAVLLEAGSQTQAVDKFGRNLCHWLVLNGDDHPLSYVLARFKDTDMERHADDGKATTPMDYAIITNNAQAVKILLSHNCKVKKVFQENESPLEFAVKRGFSDLLPCLQQAGNDVTARLANGLGCENGKAVGVNAALRHNAQMIGWLKHVTSKPRSLLDISRLAIRENLSSNIWSELDQLELPGLLKQFVLNIETSV